MSRPMGEPRDPARERTISIGEDIPVGVSAADLSRAVKLYPAGVKVPAIMVPTPRRVTDLVLLSIRRVE